MQGRLGACAAAAEEALAFSATRGWDGSWPAGAALLAQAGAQLLWNRLGAAEASLARAVEVLATSREAPLRALLGYSEARRLEALGALDRALQTMQAANDELGDWPLRPELAGVLRAYEELLLAATGEGRRAREHLAARAAKCPPSALALASLQLAAGEPAAARGVLAPLCAAEDVPALVSIRIELWVVDALAADALLDHEAAGRSLTAALALAEPAGYQRPLLGHGTAIVPMLRRAIRAGTPHRALVGELLAALEAGGEARPAPKLVADALSERELMVLRYLPTVLTNSEIAAELFVSVNTVKTHVKSIYRKLDVTERRSAVRRARALRLLAP